MNHNTLYNADSLLLLEHLPAQSVDLVYLDPPWATAETDLGNYFLFLAKRLQQINRVLSDNGNLFAHFPPDIMGQFSVLVEGIFRKKVFRDQFILLLQFNRMSASSHHRPDYSVFTLYGKSVTSVYNKPTRIRTDEETKKYYPYKDERGYYRLSSLFVPQERSTLKFEWHGVIPGANQSWKYTITKLNQLYQDGLISFDASGKRPSLKQYISDFPVTISNIWDDLAMPLSQEESTGYSSQQVITLLSRIIAAGSNTGAVILDPFCGSGSALVAAHLAGRKWIGCDTSSQACEIALQRITGLNGSTKSDPIVVKTYADIIRKYPESFVFDDPEPSISLWGEHNGDPVILHRDYVRPLIFTEGKTDWKHLKSAYARLKAMGYLDHELDIEFQEFEGGKMGDAELYKDCISSAKTKQLRKHIFIFDRDNDKIIKDVHNQETRYKSWGNNVFSFAIPVPGFREATPKVSIEFYYHDDDLKRIDDQGWRLFFSNEFNPQSGRHLQEDLNCTDIRKLSGEIKIVDDNVFNSDNQNVALSKNDFASYVLNENENSNQPDVREFKAIFDVIAAIVTLDET